MSPYELFKAERREVRKLQALRRLVWIGVPLGGSFLFTLLSALYLPTLYIIPIIVIALLLGGYGAYRAKVFERNDDTKIATDLDRRLELKGRLQTLLELPSERQDEGAALLMKAQIEKILRAKSDIAHLSHHVLTPLEKKLLYVLSLLGVAILVILGLLFRPVPFTDPQALQLAELLANEKELPAEAHDALEKLAHTLDKKDLTSDELDAALENAREALGAVEAELQKDAAKGSVVEPPSEPYEQNSPPPDDHRATPTPTPPAAPPSPSPSPSEQKKDQESGQKNEQEKKGEQQEKKQGEKKEEKNEEKNPDGEGNSSSPSDKKPQQGDQKGGTQSAPKPGEESQQKSSQSLSGGQKGAGSGSGSGNNPGGADQAGGEQPNEQKEQQSKGSSSGKEGKGKGEKQQSEGGSQSGQGGAQGAVGRAQEMLDSLEKQQQEKKKEDQKGGESSDKEDKGGQKGDKGGSSGSQAAGGDKDAEQKKEDGSEAKDKDQGSPRGGGEGKKEADKEKKDDKGASGSGGDKSEKGEKKDKEQRKDEGQSSGGKGKQSDPPKSEQKADKAEGGEGDSKNATASSKPQGEPSAPEEGEGEGPGIKGEKQFTTVEVEGEREKIDPRQTEKGGKLAENPHAAKLKTTISNVELGKPEVMKEGDEQKIPPEYKDLLR